MPSDLSAYRKRLLLTEQLALTQAIMICEGVMKRKDRTLTRGARACADEIQRIRDKSSEDTGLRKSMGWSRGRRR
jgi:hypothetical protein